MLKTVAVAFRIGFVGSELWNDKYKNAKILSDSANTMSYLPCGCVVSEIKEHAGEPVIDFIESQLFLWSL